MEAKVKGEERGEKEKRERQVSGEVEGEGEGEDAMGDGKLDSGLHRLYESFNVVTVSSTAETLMILEFPPWARKKKTVVLLDRAKPSHWPVYPVLPVSLKAAKLGKIKNKNRR